MARSIFGSIKEKLHFIINNIIPNDQMFNKLEDKTTEMEKQINNIENATVRLKLYFMFRFVTIYGLIFSSVNFIAFKILDYLISDISFYKITEFWFFVFTSFVFCVQCKK